ncbi:hypothetical protein FRC11_001531, partial [Ceratobasidium sp. 423]
MAAEYQEPVPLQTLSRRGEHPTRTSTISVSRTESNNDGNATLDESTTVPEHEGVSLPPVDKGFAAWSFVFAGFMLEALVWGFGFTYGVFQEYFLHHRTFGNASEAEIGAIGTTALAIQYFEAFAPPYLRLDFIDMIDMECALFNNVDGSIDKIHDVVFTWTMLRKLTAREFRNQSIMFGIGGGGLYAPCIIYVRKLSEWFSTRRGLAAAIVFGGSGAGGACFPIAVNFLLSNFGFRWTLRIWAGFMLIFGALALTFTRPRLPVARPQNSDGPTLWTRLRRQHWGFLRSPLFICMSLTNFIQALAYFP